MVHRSTESSNSHSESFDQPPSLSAVTAGETTWVGRRRFLSSTLAATIPAAGSANGRRTDTVAEFGTQPKIERLTPVAEEVTVAPETNVTFEVIARDFTGGSIDTEWVVDGEDRRATGPWYSDYKAQQMAFLDENFRSTGKHEIRVTVSDSQTGEELGTTNWTVTVKDGAGSAPNIQQMESTIVGKTIELSLSASDSDGDLHRVIWWSGAIRDDLLGMDTIDGAEARATMSFEPYRENPVPTAWVIDERGHTTQRDHQTGYDPLEMQILETNAPVDGGEILEVTVQIENTGLTAKRPELRFVVDNQSSHTTQTTVEPGQTETIEGLQHRTYPFEQDTAVPIRLEMNEKTIEQTVEVRGVDELPETRVAPGPELTIKPDTTVMFEVDGEAYDGITHWFRDREYEDESLGEWQSWYPTDYWQPTFESPGTHEVAAAVVGDDASYRTSWSVTVTSDGASAPAIDGIRPDPDEPLDAERTRMLELDVSDEDGLDRVVWWLTQADALLDNSEISGTENTATLEFGSGCHTCAVVVWVIDENNLLREQAVWEVEDMPRNQNTLEVTKEGVEDELAYFLLASADGVTSHDDDGIQTSTAALDWLGPERGTDAYDVAGGLDTFLLKGAAAVRWDQDAVDPTTLGEPKTGGGVSSVDHRVRVESTGTGFGIYAITASEGLEATDAEATTDGYSAIDHVGPERGVDEFTIEGEITRFLSNDHLRVYLDDARIDPQTL